MAERPEPAKPYTIHVSWIEGSEKSYPVRAHLEEEHAITMYLQDRRAREVLIPWSNVKEIVIERD